MKSLLFALALAIPAALLSGPAPAQADTKVKVRMFFGEPYYTYKVGPDYVYRKGYGWHRVRVVAGHKLSCAQARDVVRHHGFNILSTRDCSGTTYVFRARSHGKIHLVYVNSRTGAVWRG